MNHIDLCKWADLLVIAAASANIIAKLANGIVTTCYLQHQLVWAKIF